MNIEWAVKPRSIEATAHNHGNISRIRHLVGLVSGLAAGALRLESLWGFGLYALAVIATTLLMFMLTGKKKQFERKFSTLAIDSVVPAVSGYLLAWVVVYGLVEI